MATMAIFTGFFVVNQTKNFGAVHGLANDKTLALIASIGAVFNCLRFLWSWALDYFSFRIVFGTLLAM